MKNNEQMIKIWLEKTTKRERLLDWIRLLQIIVRISMNWSL